MSAVKANASLLKFLGVNKPGWKHGQTHAASDKTQQSQIAATQARKKKGAVK